MKKYILIVFNILILNNLLTAQQMFTDRSDLLDNNTVFSGSPVGICDMDQDGLDDIIRLDSGTVLTIEYQLADGRFEEFFYGSLGDGSDEWALVMADVDENGYLDIMSGGQYNELKLLMFSGRGEAKLNNLDGPSIFLQNANFVDIDNNGTIDLFACHDDSVSSVYMNSGGNLAYDLSLLNTVSTIPSDNSGNYGSIWADYDNDGDLDLYISKCRSGTGNKNDGRRVNLLFRNDGELGFTEVAENANLRPYAQSWASAFGDIDNDGDLDVFVLNHEELSVLYSNNGDGTFDDVTFESGMIEDLELLDFGFQVIMEDFNNDTYLDIFVTSDANLNFLFINHGNNTFSRLDNPFSNPFLKGLKTGAVGDLNNDGFIDIIGTYGAFGGFSGHISDKLLLNNGNDNHWLKINLKGTTSNINAIGARLEVYGVWGKQIREVRSGESYGIMNSLTTHFGLGEAEEIDSLVIRWPSGNVQKITVPLIDQTLLIREEGPTALDDIVTSEDVKLFPNPVNDILTISLKGVLNYNSLGIYSNDGRLVTTVSIKNEVEINLNTNHLQTGSYYIEVKTTEGIIRHMPFVKL